MAGEKRNDNYCRVGSMSLLDMALVCFRVWVGISHLIFHLPPWIWVIRFDLSSVHCLVTMTSDPLMSNTANSTIVLPICSREVDLCNNTTSSAISHKSFYLCLVSMMWETLWPTFDQGHFLSTSAHYPGSWSRDSLLVPWSLHASMAGSSCST